MILGPPQLKQMDFLPNMTSRALTLKWLVGSDGGHPPQRYTISIRRQGHKVFNVVKSDIGMYFFSHLGGYRTTNPIYSGYLFFICAFNIK